MTDIADTWTAVRDDLLRNPRVAAAYHDSNNEALTCLALTKAREDAGMSRDQVAVRLAERVGMSPTRARRWVRRYEDGELGGNAPLWLLHTYARAVGVVARVSVVASDGAGTDPQEVPA